MKIIKGSGKVDLIDWSLPKAEEFMEEVVRRAASEALEAAMEDSESRIDIVARSVFCDHWRYQGAPEDGPKYPDDFGLVLTIPLAGTGKDHTVWAFSLAEAIEEARDDCAVEDLRIMATRLRAYAARLDAAADDR